MFGNSSSKQIPQGRPDATFCGSCGAIRSAVPAQFKGKPTRYWVCEQCDWPARWPRFRRAL